MKTKIRILSLSLLWVVSTTSLHAQEVKDPELKEKFQIGIGKAFLNNISYDFQLGGYYLQLSAPLSYGFEGVVNFTDYSNYYDYCDSIPVNINEMHLSVGLLYPIVKHKRVTLTLYAGSNFVGYNNYKIDKLASDANVYHTDVAHSETHYGFEVYIDFTGGVGLTYLMSDRLAINLNSRLTSFGDLKGSIGLHYIFKGKKK